MKLQITKPFYFSTGKPKHFTTTSLYINLKFGSDFDDEIDQDMLNELRIYRR